jgi:hypothetical protein
VRILGQSISCLNRRSRICKRQLVHNDTFSIFRFVSHELHQRIKIGGTNCERLSTMVGHLVVNLLVRSAWATSPGRIYCEGCSVTHEYAHPCIQSCKSTDCRRLCTVGKDCSLVWFVFLCQMDGSHDKDLCKDIGSSLVRSMSGRFRLKCIVSVAYVRVTNNNIHAHPPPAIPAHPRRHPNAVWSRVASTLEHQKGKGCVQLCTINAASPTWGV